ncbi:MAG: NAD(+) diphosphatase [Deinococcus sp.]|nr:NAD(+) diphosphatase [Deinococcus sp.]
MLPFSRPDTFQASPGPLTPQHQLILFSPDGRSLQAPGADGWPRLGTLTGETWRESPVSLGRWEGQDYAVAYSTHRLTDEISLRQLAAGQEAAAGLAGYGAQVLDFHRTHRFCGRCAAPTTALDHEVARRCPACQLTVYPRVAPAVMVLIWRGQGENREFLLARGPRHAPGLFSVVAGFTEPSETLEACCHREVLEELGVFIREPRYVMSQPWPLPHSLMVAFSAEYVGGQITPQPGEIEEAHWFSIGALPQIPAPYSCAYHLIQRSLQEARAPRD